MIDHLTPMTPVSYYHSDSHKTTLRDIETDDVTASLKFFKGFLFWAYFSAWESPFLSEECINDSLILPEEQTAYFKYMEGCWRRNLVAKKKSRIIAKSPALTVQADLLLQRYPDAKLIYLMRDPLQTIPSCLSLISGVLEKAVKIKTKTTPQMRNTYYANIYSGLCHIYKVFFDFHKNGSLPESSCLIVPYSALMTDLKTTMEQIIQFAELSPQFCFWQHVEETAKKQEKFTSNHRYQIEDYGLSNDHIKKDLSFVYDHFTM